MAGAPSRRDRIIRRLAMACLVIGTLAGLVLVRNLEHDPSPFAALPDPRLGVSQFQRMRLRFGLDRLLVLAVRFPSGVWSGEGLGALDAMSRAIGQVRGVLAVKSLMSTSDLRPSEEGLLAADLVPEIPTDAASMAALRERVEGNPLFAGSLVSTNGKAALIIATLAPETDGLPDSSIVAEIEAEARRHARGAIIHLEGEPYVLSSLQAMVRRELPWFAAALVAPLVLVSVLVVVREGASSGLVAIAGTMVVVLWAASARGHSDRPVNDIEMLFLPGILAAALPAMAAFSTLRQPVSIAMRLPAISGILAALVCVRQSMPEVSKTRLAVAAAALAMVFLAATRQGQSEQARGRGSWWATFGVPALLLMLLVPATRTAATVSAIPEPLPPSQPDVLAEDFGQGEVLMVSIRGDWHDPLVLLRVARIEERIQAIPGVTQTSSVASIVRHLGGMLGDGARIPADRGKLGNILFFLDGVPELRPLVAAAGDEMLVHVTIDPDADADMVVDRCRSIVEAVNDADSVAVERQPEARKPDVIASHVKSDLARWVGLPEARVEEAIRAREEGALPTTDLRDLRKSLEEAGYAEDEASEIVLAEATGAQRDAWVRSKLRRLAAEGKPQETHVRAELLALWDPLMLLARAQAEGLVAKGLATIRESRFHAHAMGPAVYLRDAASDLRRILIGEGIAALLVLGLAGLAIGDLRPLLPVALHLLWCFGLAGPSLPQAALSPAPILLGTMLFVVGRSPRALVTGTLSALIVAGCALAAALAVELPGLREACLGIAGVGLSGAVAYSIVWLGRESGPSLDVVERSGDA